jgi:serine/threonine protein kinase
MTTNYTSSASPESGDCYVLAALGVVSVAYAGYLFGEKISKAVSPFFKNPPVVAVPAAVAEPVPVEDRLDVFLGSFLEEDSKVITGEPGAYSEILKYRVKDSHLDYVFGESETYSSEHIVIKKIVKEKPLFTKDSPGDHLGLLFDHPNIVKTHFVITRNLERDTFHKRTSLAEDYPGEEVVAVGLEDLSDRKELFDDFARRYESTIRKKPCSLDYLKNIFFPLLDATLYIHNLGVLHSDIKAENILVSTSLNHPKLLDFTINDIRKPTNLLVG